METRIITYNDLTQYQNHLIREEKSAATVEKYLRDVRAFSLSMDGAVVTKEGIVSYKKRLEEQYTARSVNSMLAALNSFFHFMGWDDYRLKVVRCQRKTYSREERELTKAEYIRLLEAAKGQKRLQLILQTICGTGIRVSELRFFTVEAVKTGEYPSTARARFVPY